MKVAVLSDVHGNLLALEAVLEDIARQGVDATVALGDFVSGPFDPAGVADRFIGLGMPSVRGNHDRYITDGREKDWHIDALARDTLNAEQHAWLAALPATQVLDGQIFLSHGTPRDDNTGWLDGFVGDSGDVALASDDRGPRRRVRLSGAAVRAYPCAAQRAAQGWATGGQSGKRWPAVRDRLARMRAMRLSKSAADGGARSCAPFRMITISRRSRPGTRAMTTGPKRFPGAGSVRAVSDRLALPFTRQLRHTARRTLARVGRPACAKMCQQGWGQTRPVNGSVNPSAPDHPQKKALEGRGGRIPGIESPV